jgi:hypothetical protein
MEKQMRAEREKRASSRGAKAPATPRSTPREGALWRHQGPEAKRQQINEAEGEASAIMAVATATAEGIEGSPSDRWMAATKPQLRVAEQHIGQSASSRRRAIRWCCRPTSPTSHDRLGDVGDQG